MSVSKDIRLNTGMVHPEFESIVQRIIQKMDKDELAEMRKDFHTRLRLMIQIINASFFKIINSLEAAFSH